MANIEIIRANEGNLKDVSLKIPKNKLVVFTGLSGSGKTTLLLDVLFNECQRQYLEAMSMQGIHKPKVERIRGASPAILISQMDNNKNPRSTVGTMTDIYTDLRMVYEKLGIRKCPSCGEMISAADCLEETEKKGNDFHVYMYCCKCGQRMDKITRTQYSFNTKEGACPACEGLGSIHIIKRDAAVNEALSLEEGGIRCWEKRYGEYQISILYKAYRHYGIPVPADIPIREFSDIQKAVLYNGVLCDELGQEFHECEPPRTISKGKFEGVFPILWRRFADKNGDTTQLDKFFENVECPQCRGERLCEQSRRVTVNGIHLPQLSFYSLDKLVQWLDELEGTLSREHEELVNAYLLDIRTKLNRFLNVGLGYLTLDRQVITLSGGELQRMRLAAVLDSDLSGIIYILDEPTVGLHPKDNAGLVSILKTLRDKENTVLVIEHDEDIMAAADYIVDIGPGAGKYGGQVIAAGTLETIKSTKESVTGNYLSMPHPGKKIFRDASKIALHIENADKYNLKNISVDIPAGCMTAVTGPSGSGKSTLVFEVLAKGKCERDSNRVSGLDKFAGVIEIEQSAITRMKRSNVATYSAVYSEIRTLFAGLDAAKAAGLSAKHFSFNTPGGRCEHCQGLGYVDSNMLFFANTEIVCSVCGGNQFNDTVLSVKYQGLSIKDVLKLSVDEAVQVFDGHVKIINILELLQDVGLGYLELGQSVTTLSGGEGQRLKLAGELIGRAAGKHNLYLLDEPTIGLHPKDIEHFMILLNRLTDAGNTVVVVEHNQQIIRNCDWVIELGPKGGDKGGSVVFAGRPGTRKGRLVSSKPKMGKDM